MSERVVCRVCHRVVAGFIPARGDGSASFPLKHKGHDKTWCDGRYHEALGQLLEDSTDTRRFVDETLRHGKAARKDS